MIGAAGLPEGGERSPFSAEERSMVARRTGRLAASLLMTAATLSACEVGPDYERPDTTLAPFHNLAAAGAETQGAAPPLDRWWTGFHDPLLEQVVNRALAQNLDLATAYARVQEARAAAGGAHANLFPTVDADATANGQSISERGPLGSILVQEPGFERDVQEYTFGPMASWEIDLAGGLRRASRAAKEEAEAADADRLATRITVAADAADAYIQIRGDQARLAVAQDQIATDTRLLQIVHLRVEAGQANDREVAQAEALLEQAQASVPNLRIALEAQLNRLDVLMGAQPGTYAQEFATPAAIPGVPPIGSDNAPVDVLRRRPDVIAAERRLAASNEQIGAAISDYYPKISISGALGFDSLSISNLFTAKSFQPIGTGAIRWRLFDFGKVEAEVAQAKGKKAEALSEYRQSVLKAAEDVENALMSLVQDQVHVGQLQREVDSLTRARDLSQRAYESGAIGLTDVLDANRQLLSARDELFVVHTAAARAAVFTFRALGGGWDPTPAALPAQ
jgi:NodT family efflux transporter outer membrane factor (OMF) lipoprotein